MIDFVLSNLANGGYLKIVVLTQYKSHSLDRHITKTWRMSTLLGNYVTPVPAQQRLGPRWFAGSADAIYQSLNLINDERPDYVIVFGADHIYRMDPQQMVRAAHRVGRGGDGGRHPPAAVAGRPVRRHRGRPTTAGGSPRSGRSPRTPTGLPDAPDEIFASMGNYVFTTAALIEAVTTDAQDPSQQARHGRQHHPDAGRARTRPTSTTSATTTCRAAPSATAATGATWGRSTRSTRPTWTSSPSHPVFNLYNFEWPIYTGQRARGRRPSSCTAGDERVGPGGRLDGLPRRGRLRRRWSSARSCPPTCRCTRGRTSRARC